MLLFRFTTLLGMSRIHFYWITNFFFYITMQPRCRCYNAVCASVRSGSGL